MKHFPLEAAPNRGTIHALMEDTSDEIPIESGVVGRDSGPIHWRDITGTSKKSVLRSTATNMSRATVLSLKLNYTWGAR